MRVSILTWNINAKKSAFSDLKSIIENEMNADILFIGLQEVYFTFMSTSDLYNRVKDCVGSYNIIGFERLFGIVSFVLSKNNLQSESFRMGLGFLNNGYKGFTSHYIQFSDTNEKNNILFVNTHLTAHEKNLDSRMKQVSECFKAISSAYNIKEIDTIILSGDMNFRVSGIDRQKVYDLIIEKNYEEILKNDQFNNFSEKYPRFKEGNINFQPSYKYIAGTDDFEVKKYRVPSYCDRILCNSKYKHNFTEYKSLENIRTSDHKPVLLRMEFEPIILDNSELLSDIADKNYIYKLYASEMFNFFHENIFLIGIMTGIVASGSYLHFKNKIKRFFEKN
ncbi:putative phosphatase [Hamiltosporidium tvaerminnensis]|uniref:Putative phosphatase n=1 Tax=Hamiltosporidium tvaerminnensis TaxID=1176355 RepID=A0A4Q9LW93_9MICR|nr:putative phosphatase [Hamiltosporidium tvaerminnensis]